MMGFSLSDVFSSIDRIENVIPIESLSNRLRFGEHKSVFKSTGHDFDQIKEVRDLWQFYRDRRPESYTPLTEL